MEIDMNFPLYCMAMMSTFGWFLLMFYLPTGMWSVVFEYIGAFATRPRPVEDAEEFNRQSAELQLKIAKVIEKGQII